MTDQKHPLTDEVCYAIDDNPSMKTSSWRDCMRAGADWQLEQVIDWFKSQQDYLSTFIYLPPDIDCESIERSLRKAMRPQENN